MNIDISVSLYLLATNTRLINMSKLPVLMDPSCYWAAARTSQAHPFFHPVLLYN